MINETSKSEYQFFQTHFALVDRTLYSTETTPCYSSNSYTCELEYSIQLSGFIYQCIGSVVEVVVYLCIAIAVGYSYSGPRTKVSCLTSGLRNIYDSKLTDYREHARPFQLPSCDNTI